MAKIEWNQVKMSDIQRNISLRLLMSIGLKNANDVMDTVQNDPLIKPPQDGNVVIVP